MHLGKKHHLKIFGKWLIITLVIFFTTLLIILGFYLVFQKVYAERIYPGIYLGEIHLGGKTENEAKIILNQKINKLAQTGIGFEYQNKLAPVMPTISSLDRDIAYDIIIFDSENTAKDAMALGRSGAFLKNISNQVFFIFKHKKVPMIFELHTEEIEKILKNNFSKYETIAENANLVYEPNNAVGNKFQITAEKYGNIINYSEGISRLNSNLIDFNTDKITLYSEIKKPQIFKEDIDGLSEQAEQLLSFIPIKLNYKDKESDIVKKTWTLAKNDIVDLLEVKTKATPDNTSAIYLGLDDDKTLKYFNDNITSYTNISPEDSKFEIKDGKVVLFQQSKDGQELNFSATFSKLEYEINKQENNSLDLAITPLKSSLENDEANDLGIKSIIGTGHSNFVGSPQNRRHNIKTGADTLNGLLVKPDEEFSLMTALGEIDGENGYKTELVIKGDKTIAEYGGGLCQIGTTMFRTVIESGLPITMRRNHSYRVSYYEPAGTDATIYDPWPDFKFINDTGNHILIQTRIEGDDIYFDFWGTPDGRTASHTEPTIYNIVKPAPTKFVETLTLAPGEKKCTEHAHNGADAFFDYEVNYADGEKLEKRFSSHYIPWREVCLIGVETLSTDKTASSTDEVAKD